MHVSIMHQEYRKTRWYGADDTFSQVLLSVTFNHSEIYSIENLRLGPMVILQRDPDALKGGDEHPGWYLTFEYLLDLQRRDLFDSYCLKSPVYARAYEDVLREALAMAKARLESNREIVGMPISYKL